MLHGTAEFGPVIDELRRNAAAHFGVPNVEIEPLRRIEGPYSNVLRVAVHAGPAQSHAYIKVFKPRGNSPEDRARVERFLLREFGAATTLHQGLAGERDLGALRPIACLPEHRAIVTAEVSGTPFADVLLRSPATRVSEIAARIGRWVRAYQDVAATGGEIELDERRRYVDDRLRLLVPAILDEQERLDVLDRLDRLSIAIGWASVPAVAIHADLTPTNVLVGADGRVTVLDFTMAKTGTRLHDLAHMYFHLDRFVRHHPSRRDAGTRAKRALLEGYDPSLTPGDPLFQLMLWQHAVCHVAMLAERRPIVGRIVQRWLIRRRWQQMRKGLEPMVAAIPSAR